VNKIQQMNLYQRHQFDPSSKGDMVVARKFLLNNKWEAGCPFYLEWPYLDIPSMIKDKITAYALKGLL
jgi:hypothetical protein